MLRKAADRGELKTDANLELLSEMLWETYQANYRLALFEDWTEDRLNARFAEQVEILLAGARV